MLRDCAIFIKQVGPVQTLVGQIQFSSTSGIESPLFSTFVNIGHEDLFKLVHNKKKLLTVNIQFVYNF